MMQRHTPKQWMGKSALQTEKRAEGARKLNDAKCTPALKLVRCKDSDGGRVVSLSRQTGTEKGLCRESVSQNDTLQ